MNGEMYWYALGYYDARAIGISSLEKFPEEAAFRVAYKEGYDRGCDDYCEFDAEEGKE